MSLNQKIIVLFEIWSKGNILMNTTCKIFRTVSWMRKDQIDLPNYWNQREKTEQTEQLTTNMAIKHANPDLFMHFVTLKGYARK